MKIYLKRIIGTTICLISVFWIFYIWLSIQDFGSRFSSTEISLLSLGRITALIGLVLFSITMVLHTRINFLLYILDLPFIIKLHHVFGSLSFILILVHPIFLATRIFITSPYMAARFLLPSDENLANFSGLAALFLMGFVIIVTNYLKGQPFIWKWIHRVMLVVLAGSLVHLLLVSSDISQSNILKWSLLLIMITGVIAFIYQRTVKYLKTKTLTPNFQQNTEASK
jgi:predicted ferric reductase